MIVFIDLEHDQLQTQAELWQQSRVEMLRNKYRLEAASGEACLLVRYNKLRSGILQEIEPTAVIVSGCYSDFVHYDEDDLIALKQIYLSATQPILGFCAGFQLMAAAYGGTIGAIGTSTTALPRKGSGAWILADKKHELGFTAVNIQHPHPLFRTLSNTIHVFENHYWAVKTVPNEFDVLASTQLCPIQTIAHQQKPLYGMQFHPEAYDNAHLDGRRILKNFFQSYRNRFHAN